MTTVYTNGRSFYHRCEALTYDGYSALYSSKDKRIVCVYTDRCKFIMPLVFHLLIEIPNHQFFLGEYAKKELPEKDCLPYEIT